MMAAHPAGSAVSSDNVAAGGLKANLAASHAGSRPGFAFDAPPPLRYPLTMPKQPEPRLDTCWRKSRIAARILLREEQGRLTRRDVALGHRLAADYEVIPRLIDQAIHGIRGKKLRLERERRTAA